MSRALISGAIAFAAAIAGAGAAFAAGPEADDPEVARARDALVERLKAAEQSGFIVSRQTPAAADTEPAPPAGMVSPQQSTAPRVASTAAEIAPLANAPCLDASSIALARAALGDDPLQSIDLIRQLEQEPAHMERDAVRTTLALAYLSIGFADEAAATVMRRAPEDRQAAAVALIAAAAGADAGEISDHEAPALCAALAGLADFAASTGQAKQPPIDAAAIDEIASLPQPLAEGITARLVSRFLDLQNAADAERLLAILEGLSPDARDPSTAALLRERLSALKSATRSALAPDDAPLSERLSELAPLIDHPEFSGQVGPAAASAALETLAGLGAANAMKRSNMLAKAPSATADYYLAKALARAGNYEQSRALAGGYPEDQGFDDVREILALWDGASAGRAGASSSVAAAWRAGDWRAAETGLRAAFANDPSASTARMLTIAAALNKSAPAPAAAALLSTDAKSASLKSWLKPAPKNATLSDARRYSDSVSLEISGLKAMVANE